MGRIARAMAVMVAMLGALVGIVGVDQSSAQQVCVYGSVEVNNGSPTTIKADSGGACPANPTTDPAPCPAGIWDREHVTVTSGTQEVAEAWTLICVRD